ncbi:fibroblast growth factor receptor-like 1 isoform X2 [Culicoides brevitarsis]
MEIGSNIQMNCTISPDHLPFNQNSSVVWYFKPCTSIFCDDSYNYSEVSNETEWIQLNHSTPILKISDLDVDRDSGLYRCSVEPYKVRENVTLNIQFVMNHHLVVIDSKRRIPHILDRTPANISTYEGQTAIFHCRVRGDETTSIRWYKRGMPHTGDSLATARSITYLNVKYDLIRAGDQKKLADDLYLSKLMLTGVLIRDSGIYGCAAMSYGGFQKQEAYLNVTRAPVGSDSIKITSSQEIRSFFWLFAIPICLFILLPCIIWMWFHTYKKQCTMEKRLEPEGGSSRWIAKPKNGKNPYLIVNLDVI